METGQTRIQRVPGSSRLWPVLGDRTVAAITLSALLVATVIYLRDDYGSPGMTEESLWTMKINWHHCADVIILGDSRSLIDVFPDVMETQLPGLRILNYSFGALGYTERYLRSAEQVLDPRSSRKTIILGIAPLTLTQGAVNENTFDITLDKPAMDKRRTRLFGRLLYILRATEIYEILDTVRGKRTTVRHIRKHRRDGSAACYMIPENPRNAIRIYQKAFDPGEYGPVRRDIIDVIVRMVEEWTLRGIKTYAFRPPTSPELVKLENRKSHYDEEELESRIEEAGGTWLRFDDRQYRTFDGSHLHPQGARRFSRDLAEKILSVSRDPNQHNVFGGDHHPLSDSRTILGRVTQ